MCAEVCVMVFYRLCEWKGMAICVSIIVMLCYKRGRPREIMKCDEVSVMVFYRVWENSRIREMFINQRYGFLQGREMEGICEMCCI